MRIQAGAIWRHPLAVVVYLLIIIWAILPLVPFDSGLRFGLLYRVYFTLLVLAAGGFFGLLGMKPLRAPDSRGRLLLSIAAVYLLVIAIPVVSGIVFPYPQLARPTAEEMLWDTLTPEEQGEKLFFGTAPKPFQPQCVLCHARGGRGGNRGPELDSIAARAGERVPEMDAEDYVRAHIVKGSLFEYNVPGFDKIMPPFENILTAAEIDALVAYLFSQ